MNPQPLEFWVGQHFVVAWVYLDRTCLSDEEERQLCSFIEREVESRIGLSYEEYTDETDEFGVCEVTGLRGPVVKVRFHPVQTWA